MVFRVRKCYCRLKVNLYKMKLCILKFGKKDFVAYRQFSLSLPFPGTLLSQDQRKCSWQRNCRRHTQWNWSYLYDLNKTCKPFEEILKTLHGSSPVEQTTIWNIMYYRNLGKASYCMVCQMKLSKYSPLPLDGGEFFENLENHLINLPV